MKIVKEDAERSLFDSIQNHWKKNTSQRCLYLKFSQSGIESQKWFQPFIKELDAFFDDKAGEVFLCNDNDVFILTKFITKKNLGRFLAHLAAKLTPAPFSRPLFSKDLAFLYEIKVDLEALKPICARKIENSEIEKNKRAQQKAEKEAELYRQKLLDIEIEKKLISTLSSRRSARDVPEILFVEDDLFSQRLIKNALGKEHYVLTAKNGREAIMTYAGKAPDILFLDIGLPDITGHDVLKKIFEIDPDAYVVMLSGKGDRENVLKAVAQGAKGFVVKPFTKEKLFQYIEKSPFVQAKQKGEGNGYSIR